MSSSNTTKHKTSTQDAQPGDDGQANTREAVRNYLKQPHQEPGSDGTVPPGTFGPHKSHLANILDPRTDSDLSGAAGEDKEKETGYGPVKAKMPGLFAATGARGFGGGHSGGSS